MPYAPYVAIPSRWLASSDPRFDGAATGVSAPGLGRLGLRAVQARSISPDPTSSEAVAARREVLAAACAEDRRTRVDIVVERCRDKEVLDVGCVAHEPPEYGGMFGPNWLHAHIVSVAKRCVGTDIDPAGIQAMTAAGYDAIYTDVTGTVEDVANMGPFEVIVAGEVIEHLGAPQGLFAAAGRLLVDGGQLVITTPNPYAPYRARCGQLNIVWESVDHVTYLFPSGIAELGERTGLILRHFSAPVLESPVRLAGRVVKWPLRSALLRLGRRNADASLPPGYISPLELAALALRRRSLMGETAIYVLEKPARHR